MIMIKGGVEKRAGFQKGVFAMKRFLSLISALVFSLLLIIPSVALSDELSVMPRRPNCPSCSTGLLNYKTITKPIQVYHNDCPNHPDYYHLQTVGGRVLICSSCGAYGGADVSQSYSLIVCTFGETDCFNPNPQCLWGTINNINII